MVDPQRSETDRLRDNTSRLNIDQPVFPTTNLKGLWKQAGRSLVFVLLVAAGFLVCFAVLALQMPHFKVCLTTAAIFGFQECSSNNHAVQGADLSALKHFPPRTLQDILSLRDLLKLYAANFPVGLLHQGTIDSSGTLSALKS